MMLPQINYNGRTLLYMADLLPSASHIPLPYVMSYDVQPLITMEERKNYWQESIDNDYALFLEHDPINECCTIQLTDKGYRLKETFSLQDRSEEHTSELQSLMRISYAVFCLQKKNEGLKTTIEHNEPY